MNIVEEQDLDKAIAEQGGDPQAQKEFSLNPEQVEKFNEAQKEYSDKINEIRSKEYLIVGGLEVANKIREWLIKESKWRYSECIAVFKVLKEIDDSIANIQGGKTGGKFYLKEGPLMALNMLYQNAEGVGWHSAVKFKDIVMPVMDTINTSLKTDAEILKRLEFKVEAYRHGIETDESLMEGIEGIEGIEGVEIVEEPE